MLITYNIHVVIYISSICFSNSKATNSELREYPEEILRCYHEQKTFHELFSNNIHNYIIT